jgi:hypothetical protein
MVSRSGGTHEQQARENVKPKGRKQGYDDVSEDGIGEEVANGQEPISSAGRRNIAKRLERKEKRGELKDTVSIGVSAP